MQLSPAQWGSVRQIAAEQARAYLDKNYKPNAQAALDLGLHPAQVEEMGRIVQATARKHMKQKDGAACPVVYVPLNESQTGRYAAEMLTQAATKIVDLESRVADLKAGNSRWQSDNQRLMNSNAQLQEQARVLQAEYDVLRAKFEDDESLCNLQSRRIIELQEKNQGLARELSRLQDPMGEASFRNHAQCVINLKHQAPVQVINSAMAPHFIPGTKFNDGDKWVDLPGKETFTFFRGEWRRQSELEGFASAQKYT